MTRQDMNQPTVGSRVKHRTNRHVGTVGKTSRDGATVKVLWDRITRPTWVLASSVTRIEATR